MFYLSDVTESQVAQFNKKKVKVKSFVREGKIVRSYDRFLNWKNLGIAAGGAIGGGLLLRRGFKGVGKKAKDVQAFLGDSLPPVSSNAKNIAKEVVPSNRITTKLQTDRDVLPDPWELDTTDVLPPLKQNTNISPTRQLLLPPATYARPSAVKNVQNGASSSVSKKLTVYGIPEDAPVLVKLQEIAIRANRQRKGAWQPRASRKSFRIAASSTESSLLGGALTGEGKKSKARLLNSQEKSIQNKTTSIENRKQKIKDIRDEWEAALREAGYVPKKQQRLEATAKRLENELEEISVRNSGKKGYRDDSQAKNKLRLDFKQRLDRNKRIQKIKRQIKENVNVLGDKTNIGMIDNRLGSRAKANLIRARRDYNEAVSSELERQRRGLSRLRNPIVKNYEELKEELFKDLVGSTLPKTVNSKLIEQSLGRQASLAYKNFNGYKDFEKLWADYEKWGKTKLTRRELGILSRNFGTKMTFKKPTDTAKTMTAISNIFKAAPQYKMALQKSGLNPIEVKLSPEDYERLINHYAMGQGNTVRLLLRFLGLPV